MASQGPILSATADKLPGLVRPARRPAGFLARGPRPAAPPELVPRAGEDLCYLSGDWRIFQKRRGHRWSLDDLVTAWAAVRAAQQRDPARPVREALDLGCGIGSVLLLVAWALPEVRSVGVEAQAESAELARRSIAWNGAGGRVRVLDADLRDPLALPAGARFDLVTGTPPYFDFAAGTASPVAQRRACRFEERGGAEAYLAAGARWLADDGLLALCAQSPQRARVQAAAAREGLAIALELEVIPKEGKPPLVDVFVLGRAQTPTSREALVVRDARGQWTPAFRAVRAELGMP